jgi:hypothetical protein
MFCLGNYYKLKTPLPPFLLGGEILKGKFNVFVKMVKDLFKVLCLWSKFWIEIINLGKQVTRRMAIKKWDKRHI